VNLGTLNKKIKFYRWSFIMSEFGCAMATDVRDGFMLHSQCTCESYGCNCDVVVSLFYRHGDRNSGNAVRILCAGRRVGV
jgi:hypothetical protein